RQPEGKCLERAGDREQREAGRIEHLHGMVQAFDYRVAVERDQAGQARDSEIPPVEQRGRRYRSDQHVTDDSTGRRGGYRQYENAEQVETLPDADRRATDCENEGSAEIERDQEAIHHVLACHVWYSTCEYRSVTGDAGRRPSKP